MASHSSSSESQCLRLSWRDLILGKVRNGSVSIAGDILGFCRVGSSDVPRFPTALTTSSMESVASVFRKMPQAVDCLDSTSCDRMQGSFKLRDLQL